MGKTVDCLLIGHNDMDFAQYEKTLRRMGENSGAYRDLSLNFIRYNKKPYTVADIFNIFYYQGRDAGDSDFFHVAEAFSAAVAYLGTYLDRREYTFDYINSFRYAKAELAEKLSSDYILTIAITTTLYVSMLPIIEIIQFIKRYNRDAKIIVGGPFVSTKARTLPEEELKYLLASNIGADFYVNSSQGETALVNIIHALKHDLPLEQVNNIYYKTPGGITAAPVLKENNKLSDNMVNWELFGEDVGGYVNVRTSISCPYSCAYCGFPHHAGAYQNADVKAVEGELQELDRIKTVKSVRIVDDTFNIPVSRFKAILRMMIKHQFHFKWNGYIRCQGIDEEMVQLMKESRCEGVFLGLESGNNQILRNMNKRATVQDYLKGIELLKKHGITLMGNFIIGFPGETRETVRDTLGFIEKSGLDFFHAQLWYCEPITPIWKKREVFDIQGESFEWSHAAMNSSTACDLIEQVFFAVSENISTWVPQYSFDFDNIWHLTNRGMSLDRVKGFLNSFNLAVKEKLKASPDKEVSYEVLKQVQASCSSLNPIDKKENHTVNISEADFEFL